MKAIRWMAAGLAASALLTGCVVTQNRSGEYSFGFIEPGATVAQFQSANGATRLRRHHLDGNWSLRFSDKLTVYNMGAFDNVRVVSTHTTGNRTAVLLERTRRGCTDHELLTIANNRVDRNAIRTGCNTPLQAAVIDDRMVIRETSGQRPQFWIWGTDGVRRGREPAPQRAAARPAPAPAPAPVAAPRPGPSSSPAPRPQVAQRPQPAPAVVMPSGSIETEVLTPTRVVLEHGQ